MKKLFSLLTAFLFAGSMMAADSYVKVTEAPTDWSGDYLIVYEGDATHDAVAFNGGLETLDANSNNIAVTITDGVIAATDELNAAKFTIAAVTGGYSVQAANGKFIGATAYANSLVAVDEAIVNSLSISNGNAVIGVTTSGGDVTLRYNYAKNTWRFRYYKSGQQAIALYKFVAEQGGETPAEPKFYITGESLVGSWEPNALPSYEESYVFEELAAGEYVCKITVDGTWATAKGWSDLTTVAPGVLQAQTDDNIYFKLDEAGTVTVHYDGEYFFLTGEFHVEPAPAVTYYMKNNWDGGEWSWKEMVKDDDPEETRETHVLANVVFGGTGVNINTAESDEGAFFVAKENIVAFDLNYDAAELGELDTVVFYFHPDEVNRYNLEEENGLAALIIGKYVPEPKPLYYIAGEGEGLSWEADKWIAAFEVSTKLDLKAGDYKLKVVDGENWKGFSDLTTQAEGLSADADGNICFKLDADGEVNVHYEAEFFFLNGEFHVEPAPAVTYYMKNNWDGGEWSWKAMVKDDDPEETRETHVLANVVFGGTGVNINTVESDEGAFFVAKENIVAFDLNYDAAELGELDTVVFYFHPDEVNRYNLAEENGLAALIIGKYVPEPDKYYMKHNFDGENWEWREMTYMSAEEAGDVTYKLEDVIFRGGGVNINTAESDEGAMWIEAQYIEAYDLNYEPATLEAGDKVVFMFVPELVSVHEFKYGLSAIIIEKAEPIVPGEETIIYNWSNVEAEQVGTTIIGATGVTLENVKIHVNKDNVPAIKLANSYNYADGKWIAIKPAEGGFKAGDKVHIAICFSNSDDTKQAQVKAFAADGKTELFLTAQGINGRTAAGEPVEETFTLAADQDSILLGRYGNTATFITTLNVTREGGETPAEPLYYIAGEGEGLSWDADKWIAAFEVSTKLDLKAGDYKLKVVDGENWKGFSDLTTQAEGLSADADGNICFKLDADGEVNVHYEAEFFFLNGKFHVEAAPAVTYYMKNNWDGGEWSWKEMVKDDDPEETRETHVLANVVFGGTGVNINTVESDEGAFFVAKENIVAFDLNYDAAELGELDTVVFYFHPDEVNRYNLEEENGLAALIIGKYVAPIEPEHTYTVAGNSDIAFGTKWDPTNTDNDMALQEDGSYKWEKSELELPAGTISFKVCEDHAWNVSYPSQDYALAIPEAGIYTITITFNAGQVAAEAVKTGSAEIDPTVSIMGSWDSWAKELVFTLAEDKLTATLEHEFTETATYEFKVILNGNDWRSNGYEYHRDFTGAEGITGNADNMKLVVDKAGKYIITWTFETNGINIEFPLMTDLDLIGADGKAVKVLQNGQIKIMRGDKVYNAIGLEIR